MHYKPTEQYRAHFDFLGDGEAEGGGGGDGRGHRLVTVFAYSQPLKGGQPLLTRPLPLPLPLTRSSSTCSCPRRAAAPASLC